VPATRASRVDRDATVRVTFSVPIVAPAPGSIRLVVAGTGRRVEVRLSASGSRARVDPAERLAPWTRYRVTVTTYVRSTLGARAIRTTWTFRTGPG
jgi:hypothetical protein